MFCWHFKKKDPIDLVVPTFPADKVIDKVTRKKDIQAKVQWLECNIVGTKALHAYHTQHRGSDDQVAACIG